MAPHIAIRRFETSSSPRVHLHLTRQRKHARLCLVCGERTALYRTWKRPMRVAWDPTHTLCFACFRSLKDSMRMGGSCQLAGTESACSC